MSDFDFETWAEAHRNTTRTAIPPEKLDALRELCRAELKRRGIDDIDAFLREQEAEASAPPTK